MSLRTLRLAQHLVRLTDIENRNRESFRRQALLAQQRILSRRTASIADQDQLADLATVGAYLMAYQNLEGDDWGEEMMSRFSMLDDSDLYKIYNYARKLYNKRLPNPPAQQAIREYNKKYGLPSYKHLKYVPVDEEIARKIAEEYERLPTGTPDPHTPEGQRAIRSYEALKKEVDQQFDHLPVEVEPWNRPGQPYKNSREMMLDVIENDHMWVFEGGEDHPMLSREENFKFRAVHDYYAHAAHGFGFGPRGEENAWLAHRQMFSPEAIPALTNETKAQNSWVNFGPHGERNRVNPEDTQYAAQKAHLIPEHYARQEHPYFV